jgi:predicted SprT family Zn-dependent metalloprotease
MKIPKRFKLLGATIEVVENPNLVREEGWCGVAKYSMHIIELAPVNSALQCSNTYIEQTFCHELVHFLLHATGEPIRHNEQFTEILGNCLHQVLTTMEY